MTAIDRARPSSILPRLGCPELWNRVSRAVQVKSSRLHDASKTSMKVLAESGFDAEVNSAASVGTFGAEPAVEKKRDYKLLALLVFACYAGFLLLTLSHYGVTWDEVGFFNYGYAQWDAVLHGKTSSLQDPMNYFTYGSLPSMTAAATHHLFHRTLGWLSADAGYHLSNVGFALLLALGIIVWGKQTLGYAGAAIALGTLMLLPRLWPDAHNNISDLPGAAGYLWAAWAVWWIEQAKEARARDYVLCGLVFGIAYSLRAPNIYFLGLAVAIWLGWRYATVEHRSIPWWGPLVALVVFFVTVKAANPFLWHGSVLKQVLWTNPNSYLYSGGGKEDLWFMGHYYGLGGVPRYYAPWLWLITTPLLVLFSWALGIARAVQNRDNAAATALFWLVLCGTAVFKHVFGFGNYDGVRHFLECYAPMSLLAAYGSLQLAGWIGTLPAWGKACTCGLVCFGFMSPIYSGWRIHPYESGYFNVLAGSMSRAWKDYEVEYWGYSFLRGSQWVRDHVDRRATVYVPDAGHLGKYYLDGTFKVATMTSYDFPGVNEFVSHLGGALNKASPGSIVMVLNRPRIWQRYYFDKNIAFECPPGWSLRHQEGPDSRLPPMMVICQKND